MASHREDNKKTTVINQPKGQETSKEKCLREIIFRNKIETTITIPVKINNRSVMAVVDTGAEISVISTAVANSMNKSLQRKQEVKLKGADKNSEMKGYRLETIDLQIDKKSYPWTIYESEIHEDFILEIR